jgi:CO/xanthine dehydrogenase FAD-binding subunit
MHVARPRDLDGLLASLEADPGATLLAGGTDLMVAVNLQHHRPDAVIALRRVDDLKGWDGSFIGAGVTYRRMEAGPVPALAELARTVGSPQIRAAGTLGGMWIVSGGRAGDAALPHVGGRLRFGPRR